jgi:multiple sugar transport system ATP-binding protein
MTTTAMSTLDHGRAVTTPALREAVARLDPASRITEGHDARLWVDVRKLHVFDPSTGRNLSLGAAGSPAGGAGAAAPAGAAGTVEAEAAGAAAFFVRVD